MKTNFLFQLTGLICIFITALVMEIIPWPNGLQSFKPAWLVLSITFWALSIPEKVNIGFAFILGLVWDLVLGSVMGVHALVLSVFIYIVVKYHLILRNLSLWLQSLLIILFIFTLRIAIFILELVIHNATFHWQEIFGALISGLLWPWLFLLFKKIQCKLKLN